MVGNEACDWILPWRNFKTSIFYLGLEFSIFFEKGKIKSFEYIWKKINTKIVADETMVEKK